MKDSEKHTPSLASPKNSLSSVSFAPTLIRTNMVHGFRGGRLLVGVRAPVLALSAGDLSCSASSGVDVSACGWGVAFPDAGAASPLLLAFCSDSFSLISRSLRSLSFRSFFSFFLAFSFSSFSLEALRPLCFKLPLEGTSFGVSGTEIDVEAGVELVDARFAGTIFGDWDAGVDPFAGGVEWPKFVFALVVRPELAVPWVVVPADGVAVRR